MEQIFEYAKSLGDNLEIHSWLSTAARKAVKTQKISVSELEHIVDWFYSSDAPKRLQKMSVSDAKRLSNKWMERNKIKGKDLKDSSNDIEEFMSFKDNSKIVKLLSKSAFKREGYLMSHCLGGYSIRDGYNVYSLRDKDNNPHATFEIHKQDSNILQIKGKGNGPIHPKYIHRVLEFLKKLGMNIRPTEMQNLGYYHVPSVHLKFIKQRFKNEKLVKLNEKLYAI